MPDTINQRLPSNRRYSRPFTVTLSDTVADRNLQRNGVPYLYLENIGTAGKVNIAWEPNGDLCDIYLAQGEVREMGLCRHAKDDGTDAGVELRGYMGIDTGGVR